MISLIKDFFSKENVEFYSVLSYSHCRVIRGDIIDREGFAPKSVIVFLVPYYTGETVNISKYAASLDYHIIVKELTGKLIGELKKYYPNNFFVGYGDHSPIDERHAALIGGLGILGDNGLLINKKYGSYVFIAEVISDIGESEIQSADPEKIMRCEGCGMCKASCPTGRLSHGGKCLSEITQQKGELSDSEVDLMKEVDTVWGCDACQSVCPHNESPILTPIDFFYKDKIVKLTSQILDEMTEDEFSQRAFSWRKRKTVERNLQKLGY